MTLLPRRKPLGFDQRSSKEISVHSKLARYDHRQPWFLKYSAWKTDMLGGRKKKRKGRFTTIARMQTSCQLRLGTAALLSQGFARLCSVTYSLKIHWYWTFSADFIPVHPVPLHSQWPQEETDSVSPARGKCTVSLKIRQGLMLSFTPKHITFLHI